MTRVLPVDESGYILIRPGEWRRATEVEVLVWELAQIRAARPARNRWPLVQKKPW